MTDEMAGWVGQDCSACAYIWLNCRQKLRHRKQIAGISRRIIAIKEDSHTHKHSCVCLVLWADYSVSCVRCVVSGGSPELQDEKEEAEAIRHCSLTVGGGYNRKIITVASLRAVRAKDDSLRNLHIRIRNSTRLIFASVQEFFSHTHSICKQKLYSIVIYPYAIYPLKENCSSSD